MAQHSDHSQPGEGLRVKTESATYTNLSGVAVAQYAIVKLADTDDDAQLTQIIGQTDATTSKQIGALGAFDGAVDGAIGTHLIVLEPGGIADDKAGECATVYQGPANTAAGQALGDYLTAEATGGLLRVPAAGERLIAIATSTTTSGVTQVIFDGLNGFGFEPV